MAAAKEGKVQEETISDDMSINNALENLGFSKDLTVKRWKISDNAEICETRITNRNWRTNIDVIIAGSRGEGLGVSFESDVDVIFVDRSIKCFEKTPSDEDTTKYDAVFKLDTEYAPPGYTWLEKVSLQEREGNFMALGFLKEAITHRYGKQYLKNDRDFIGAIAYNASRENSGWLGRQFQMKTPSGPAKPFNIPLPLTKTELSIDYVTAFPCSFPSIELWCSRKRSFGWPSKDLIDAIKKFDVFVVPAGIPNTDIDRLQWRLSFTLAERELVRSFNDVQIKLYAVMKLLTKRHLKPVCENISSYMIKNVIFWVIEEKNNNYFSKENFCKLLLEMLCRLKTCLEEEALPNYMTPERNLLDDKISKSERICLLSRLDEVMQDVRKAVFECPLIYEIEAHSEEKIWLNVLGQLLAAILAIPPHQCDDVEKELHAANSPFEILHILLKCVVPTIRQTNPYGFFDLLISISDQEIIEAGKKCIKNVEDLTTLFP